MSRKRNFRYLFGLKNSSKSSTKENSRRFKRSSRIEQLERREMMTASPSQYDLTEIEDLSTINADEPAALVAGADASEIISTAFVGTRPIIPKVPENWESNLALGNLYVSDESGNILRPGPYADEPLHIRFDWFTHNLHEGKSYSIQVLVDGKQINAGLGSVSDGAGKLASSHSRVISIGDVEAGNHTVTVILNPSGAMEEDRMDDNRLDVTFTAKKRATPSVNSLRATDDFNIHNYGDEVWSEGTQTPNSQQVSVPIADKLGTKLSVKAKVNLGDYKADEIKVHYKWTIAGKNGTPTEATIVTGSGIQSLQNLAIDIDDIQMPDAVGQYELTLSFEFEGKGKVLSNSAQEMTNPLYVVIDRNYQSNPHIGNVELATEMASGTSSVEQALAALTEGLYEYAKKNNWSYVQVQRNGNTHSNCTDMVDNWSKLSKALGIKTDGVNEEGTYGHGFLSKINPANLTSFDGQQGNASQSGATDPEDRWFFDFHRFGKDAGSSSTKIYDPTFGKVYDDISTWKSENVFADATEEFKRHLRRAGDEIQIQTPAGAKYKISCTVSAVTSGDYNSHYKYSSRIASKPLPPPTAPQIPLPSPSPTYGKSPFSTNVDDGTLFIKATEPSHVYVKEITDPDGQQHLYIWSTPVAQPGQATPAIVLGTQQIALGEIDQIVFDDSDAPSQITNRSSLDLIMKSESDLTCPVGPPSGPTAPQIPLPLPSPTYGKSPFSTNVDNGTLFIKATESSHVHVKEITDPDGQQHLYIWSTPVAQPGQATPAIVLGTQQIALGEVDQIVFDDSGAPSQITNRSSLELIMKSAPGNTGSESSRPDESQPGNSQDVPPIGDVAPSRLLDVAKDDPVVRGSWGNRLFIPDDYVLDNDENPHGTPINIITRTVTSKEGGTVTKVPGGFWYDHPTDFKATSSRFVFKDSFIYEVEYIDSLGNRRTDAARVPIQINNVPNLPPEGTSDSFTVPANTSTSLAQSTFTADDTDPEGTKLTMADAYGGPGTKGSVRFMKRFGVVYTPPENYTGPDHFFYDVMDEDGGFDRRIRVDIRVEGIGAVSDSYGVEAGGSVEISLLDNDWGEEIKVIALRSLPAGITLEPIGPAGSGRYLLSADESMRGPVSFTYIISDVNNKTAQAGVNIAINNPNPPESPFETKLDKKTKTLHIKANHPGQTIAFKFNELNNKQKRYWVESEGLGFRSFKVSNVERIVFEGSEGADIFTNETDVPAVIRGNGGDDTLTGGGGRDHIAGGSGSDTIRGRGGKDKLEGGEHNDFLFGGKGADIVDGGAGVDEHTGGKGKDKFYVDSPEDKILDQQKGDKVYTSFEEDSAPGKPGDPNPENPPEEDVPGEGEESDPGETPADETEIITYTSFDGDTYTTQVWQGEHVSILVPVEDLSNYDSSVLQQITAGLDRGYEYYVEMTGRRPAFLEATTHNGRLTIAAVESTCGAACGYLGFNGIEILKSFFQSFHDGVKDNGQFAQFPFYELGRNFWFYGDQLTAPGSDPMSAVTGYAVAMGFFSLDSAGVSGGPFREWTYEENKQVIAGLIDTYAADENLTFKEAFTDGIDFSGNQLGGPDIFASLLFRLSEDYGPEFIRNLWREVDKRPSAATDQEAIDNFFLAASYAASTDLSERFVNDWRWPVSQSALAEAALIGPENVEGQPIANDDYVDTKQGKSVEIRVRQNDTDPDGDKLTVRKFTQGANGKVQVKGPNRPNVLVYTPKKGFSGTDTFTYTIGDGHGNRSTATVTVEVVNGAPVATNDHVKTRTNNSVEIRVRQNDTDPDGDKLTVRKFTQGANGKVEVKGPNRPNVLVYTPKKGFSGTDTFTYTIDDGHGNRSTATVTVEVVNGQPVANDDHVDTKQGKSVEIRVRQNDTDPDGDKLTVRKFTQGANGKVEVKGPNRPNVLVYTPKKGFSGTDTFTYTIDDGHGKQSTATVTVNVIAVDRVPEAQLIGGTLTIVGGSGKDEVSVTQGNNVLTVIFNGRQKQFTASEVKHISFDGNKGDDKFTNGTDISSTLRGGSGNDTLIGGSNRDVIYGGSGNDILKGGAGDDTFYGGDGDDEIRGNRGRDEFFAGLGADSLWGGEGQDIFHDAKKREIKQH